jgi:alkanesulfonate monooxygenase SsuD/methylene tetrahydromethanopterin reductase-like flavin-dependent oxidoreductase (luciferase family)
VIDGTPNGHVFVKFSVWYDFRNPAPWRRPYGTLYRELLDQIEWLDGLGTFDHVWLSEHHFTDEGYLPAITPMLAAIAERTQHLRIGTQVMLAPLHHPLRIAEDIAVVDQLSGGRVSLGLAPGYLPHEFVVMGIPKRERGSRTSETIEILKKAWSGERFTHQGSHFAFDNVIVTPPPLQLPHPPIWVGGSSSAAARRAGRYGCHFMSDEGTSSEVIHLFRETFADFGGDPLSVQVSTNRMVFVCEDAQTGWDEVNPHLLYVHNRYRDWYAEAGEHEAMGPRLDDPDQLPRDLNIVGTPEDVIAEIKRQDLPGRFDSLTFWASPPGLPVKRSTESLRLFAEIVAPALVGASPS